MAVRAEILVLPLVLKLYQQLLETAEAEARAQTEVLVTAQLEDQPLAAQ